MTFIRRSRSHIVACWLVLTCVIGCATPPPSAPGPVGQLSITEGSPVITRNGRDYIAGSEAPVFVGDILQTDARSRALVLTSTGTRIGLAPGTHIIINASTGSPQRRHTRLTMRDGTVRIQIPAKGPEDRLTLGTPVAMLNASSGDFIAGFLDVPNTLETVLLSGESLHISNDDGSVTLDNAGYGATVIGGSAPQAAGLWPAGKLAAAVQRPASP